MSRADVSNALPELQAAYHGLQAAMAAHGATFHVAAFGGLRTESDTVLIKGYRAADYAKEVATHGAKWAEAHPIGQWRPIAKFGNSFHNYGAAFDVAIDSLGSFASRDAMLAEMGRACIALGLRWGGNFAKSESSGPDPAHFELALTLAEVKERWENPGNNPLYPDEPRVRARAGFTTWATIAVVALIAFLIVLARRF